MDICRSTEFKRREVDPDPLRFFESRVTEVTNSIIALAFGTHEDGSPNAIGTGFCVANAGENAGLFATCRHVMQTIIEIKNMDPATLKEEGLIDKKRRIAFLNKEKYEWKEVGSVKFSSDMHVKEGNFFQIHDACICYIPEIILPPLSLSPDEYFMGSELGILGFPNFEHLQRLSVQPFALKTILSSHMRYPFYVDSKWVESERIALDCLIGQGFSGSPVFSVRDGKIVGMVDYLPLEMDFADVKITKPSQIEGDARIKYPAGISFAVPSKLINICLDCALKGDWNNPDTQTLTVPCI